MPKIMQNLIEQYVEAVKKIYGSHVRQIILYGSYARGDYREDSDVDIMILVDMSDLELIQQDVLAPHHTVLIWIIIWTLSLLQKVKHILRNGFLTIHFIPTFIKKG